MYSYIIYYIAFQALTVLNHAGICLSYTSAWKHLRELTAEAKYQEVVKTGHWLWVYDNLNVHQKVRHERLGGQFLHVLKFAWNMVTVERNVISDISYL